MYEVEVYTTDNTKDTATLNTSGAATITNSHLCTDWCNHGTSNNISYWYSTNKYFYQIICPKPRCKKANWLEIDQMKECSKCGSMLKAVSKKADFEIEVDA